MRHKYSKTNVKITLIPTNFFNRISRNKSTKVDKTRCKNVQDERIRQRQKDRRKRNHLLPETSMSLMATAIQGSINKVVNALMRNEADSEPIPRSERRTSTPASSRI